MGYTLKISPDGKGETVLMDTVSCNKSRNIAFELAVTFIKARNLWFPVSKVTQQAEGWFLIITRKFEQYIYIYIYFIHIW